MYKLIIMDINMAPMDGVETTKQIRAKFGNYFNRDTH